MGIKPVGVGVFEASFSARAGRSQRAAAFRAFKKHHVGELLRRRFHGDYPSRFNDVESLHKARLWDN
jgi:hypothetical protein